ncbi:MAG TPA: hypothetical protein VFD70_30935, partial [Anaerolineae bacterium]|nr:hypothetical protein [Anaerolineae bacterium]
MKKRTVIPIIVGLFFVSVSLFTDTPYQRVLASSAVLTHGPLVGGVTANTARVFVRTNGAAEVQVRY